jgi:hypothetical protein
VPTHPEPPQIHVSTPPRPKPPLPAPQNRRAFRAEKPGLFYGFPECHTQAGGDPYLRPAGPGWPLPDPKFNANKERVNCDGGGEASVWRAQEPGLDSKRVKAV